jgi:hypothetical protein
MGIVYNLTLLFLVAMYCHGELAQNRPSTRYLTQFYLLMSLGGVLGGLFNALIAPVVFNSLAEYSLAIVCACLLLPRGASYQNSPRALFLDFALPAVVFLLALALFSGFFEMDLNLNLIRRLLHQDAERPSKFLVKLQDVLSDLIKFGPPLVLAYLFVDRPLRFGLCIGGILLASPMCESLRSNVIYQTRSFFGVLKIERDSKYHRLVHGTTLHGKQRIESDTTTPVACLAASLLAGDASALTSAVSLSAHSSAWNNPRCYVWRDLRREPLTYYHREGPVGQMFLYLLADKPQLDVAIIGLGTGSVAGYAEKGDSFTYYEIDKTVRAIAQDPRYFHYLKDAQARGANITIRLGDARVELKRDEDKRYQLILIDAFSSDAIPVHLITKEAIQLYLKRLSPGGYLAFHISNRHLDLEHVLANLEKDMGLIGIMDSDSDDDAAGKAASTWVLLTPLKPGETLPSQLDQLDWEHEYDPAKDVSRYYLAQDGKRLSDEDRAAFLKGQRALYEEYFGNLDGIDVRYPARRGEWQPLWWERKAKVGVWTDDYSNILGVFREYQKLIKK